MESTPSDNDDKDEARPAKTTPAAQPWAKVIGRLSGGGEVRPKAEQLPKVSAVLESQVEVPKPEPPAPPEAKVEVAPAIQTPDVEEWRRYLEDDSKEDDAKEEDEDDDDQPAPVVAPDVVAAPTATASPAEDRPIAYVEADELRPIQEVLDLPPLPEPPRPAPPPSPAPPKPTRHENWATPPPPPPETSPAASSFVTNTPETTVSAHSHPELAAEVRLARRNSAGNFLTTLLIGYWLHREHKQQAREQLRANRKFERAFQQQAGATQTLREQLTGLRQSTEQMQRPEHPYFANQAPPVAVQQEQLRQHQAAAQAAERLAINPNSLAPGQHIERAWYDEVVDEHGKVVEGAVEHGRAFYEEQRVEKQPGLQPTPGAGGAGPHDTTFYAGSTATPPSPYPGYGPGTIPPAHQLPTDQVDPQHRLEERNGLASSLSDPWVWVGVAVLILAFLGALFIK